jgi:hypothetical protein
LNKKITTSAFTDISSDNFFNDNIKSNFVTKICYPTKDMKANKFKNLYNRDLDGEDDRQELDEQIEMR